MTRPLRVLGITDDLPRGVDWYRIQTPLSQLHRHGCQVAICPRRQLAQRWYDWADVIVFNTVYPTTPEGLYALKDLALRQRKVLVLDIDDDHWCPDPGNRISQEGDPAPGPYAWSPMSTARPMIERVGNMAADLITTTTDVLAGRLTQRFPGKIPVVLPNCVNPADWAFDRAAVRRVPRPTVGVFGGESHHEDWRVLAEVFPVIAKQYSHATLVVGGYLPDYLADLGLGSRLVHLPSVPVTEFPRLVANFDIGLCPLVDTPFNRAKSPIKLYEFSMVGAFTVVSRTIYHAESNRLMLINDTADSAQEWIDNIAFALEVDRARHGRFNREKVLAATSIEVHAERWATAYKDAWRALQ